MPNFGTLSISDLLATTQQSVAEVGEQRVFDSIDVALQAHRALMREKVADFVVVTTDRQRRYGGPDSMDLEAVDEFGTPDAQKVSAGATVGFPLRRFAISLQWTRHWFMMHTPAELAAQVQAIQDGDIRRVDFEIRRAIFTPTNSTFTDRLVDMIELPVKALVNADGEPIPMGPNAVTFNPATHTHYLGRAGGSFAAADLDALGATVREHYDVGEVVLYIPAGLETAVRGFTGFVPYPDPRVIFPDTATRTQGRTLDYRNTTNRAIGIYGSYEVWVKPWMPNNYVFAWCRGAPEPLVMRERLRGPTGLQLEYDDEVHPLRARTLAHEFGIAPWNRTNGAVLYTGSGTYTAPTLTL